MWATLSHHSTFQNLMSSKPRQAPLLFALALRFLARRTKFCNSGIYKPSYAPLFRSLRFSCSSKIRFMSPASRSAWHDEHTLLMSRPTRSLSGTVAGFSPQISHIFFAIVQSSVLQSMISSRVTLILLTNSSCCWHLSFRSRSSVSCTRSQARSKLASKSLSAAIRSKIRLA